MSISERARPTGTGTERVQDDLDTFRKVTIEIEYHDRAGKDRTGAITMRRATIEDQIDIQTMRSQLAKGVPYNSLPPETQQFFAAVAILSVVTERTKDGKYRCPDWLDIDKPGPEIGEELLIEIANKWQRWATRSFRERDSDGKETPRKQPVVRLRVVGEDPGEGSDEG